MKLTTTAHLYAVKFSWEDEWILKACDSPTMAEHSDEISIYVYIGPRELTAEIPDEKELLRSSIASLRLRQAKIAAEAQTAQTKIEETIQSLLALPAPSDASPT